MQDRFEVNSRERERKSWKY